MSVCLLIMLSSNSAFAKAATHTGSAGGITCTLRGTCARTIITGYATGNGWIGFSGEGTQLDASTNLFRTVSIGAYGQNSCTDFGTVTDDYYCKFVFCRFSGYAGSTEVLNFVVEY